MFFMIDFLIICCLYLYYWLNTFYLISKAFLINKLNYCIKNFKIFKFITAIWASKRKSKLSNRQLKKSFFLQQKKQKKWFLLIKIIFLIGVLCLIIYFLIVIYLNSFPPEDTNLNGLLAQDAKLNRAVDIYTRRINDARDRLLFIKAFCNTLSVFGVKLPIWM